MALALALDPPGFADTWGDGFRVEQGDAFDLIPGLPANSIDLVVTSPPYWGHRTYALPHNWGV